MTDLTPAQIASVTFPAHKNGYDQGAVDSFLDDVRETLAGEIARIEELEGALSVAKARIAELEAQPVAPVTTHEATATQAVSVLALAQRTADEAVAKAHREAGELVEAAEAKASELLTEADAAAAQLRTEARAERERLMAESSDLRDSVSQLREGVLAQLDAVRAAVLSGPAADAAAEQSIGEHIVAEVSAADAAFGSPEVHAEAGDESDGLDAVDPVSAFMATQGDDLEHTADEAHDAKDESEEEPKVGFGWANA